MTTKQHQNLTMNIIKRQPSPSINSLTNQSTRTYTMTSQSSRPYQTESSEKIKIKQNCSKVKGQIISVKRTSSALRERTNSTKKKVLMYLLYRKHYVFIIIYLFIYITNQHLFYLVNIMIVLT